MNVRALVGSGDRIMALTAPFLVVGLALNVWRPSLFSVGGPPTALKVLSAIMLVPGIIVWAWSAALILTRVPRTQLITDGPYSLVKHPLYTAVSFLVLPWAGFLLNTWLGALIGAVLYAASRRFAPDEEKALSEAFGKGWDEYADRVRISWL